MGNSAFAPISPACAAKRHEEDHPAFSGEQLASLLIDNDGKGLAAPNSCQPVTMGIPFPQGMLTHLEALTLVDHTGRPRALQTCPLSHWKDGSVKWLLMDFLLGEVPHGNCQWSLGLAHPGISRRTSCRVQVRETAQTITVETGAATFQLNRTSLQPFGQVVLGDQGCLDASESGLFLRDAKGRRRTARIERVTVGERGPVRATVCLEGVFTGSVPCGVVARLCFFAGRGLVRLRLTVHNPQRAHHPQGLWDLGDAGSIDFRDLSLELALGDMAKGQVAWHAEPQLPVQRADAEPVEIYQDSSGGDNWRSINHVNRHGQVPCSFRGYRVRGGDREEAGLRASPVVSLQGPTGSITAAVPEFWQQFPKAIEADARRLRIRLFPEQFGDLFELQAGEQKTHTIWLSFDANSQLAPLPLAWVHQPVHVGAAPEWYVQSGALAPFAPPAARADTALHELLAAAVDCPTSLAARREVIDEYGWRNFGEVHADHEGKYYEGPAAPISHFNNQYDVVYGTLLHYLRTGNPAWLELCDPLARHVMDIDIYHTDRDKAAYNGGLFWFTDHYKSAGTCTHRTYSKANCPRGDRSYGGGPSSAHNFTTGLLHYYYLTGDPNARAAVLSLADWVVAMDDGRRNILGWADDGPTGMASATFQLEYQGPGRGCGNSINALLDAWLLTGQRDYLAKAELLIRRCIHPDDDVAARDLLNVEARWSYTVFLSALARYLRLKAEAEELDNEYAYARASLVQYAEWMVDNEIPYLDQRDKLEFPTEAWAAQDLRKANVMRLAAGYTEGSLHDRLLQRGQEIADRAWRDLMGFESRTVARALALVMVEGLQDLCLRLQPPSPAQARPLQQDFGAPVVFVPQKHRVMAQLKSVSGLCSLAFRLMNPAHWRRA
jgi:hypothetical protein